MPILRLAYVALFLIALIAVFTLWSEVAGQGHLDLLPWEVKLILGVGAAFAAVKATAASVSGKQAWNAGALRWLAALAVLLALCGLAADYAHLYLEDDDEQDQQDEAVSPAVARAGASNELRQDRLTPCPRQREVAGRGGPDLLALDAEIPATAASLPNPPDRRQHVLEPVGILPHNAMASAKIISGFPGFFS
ncbi:MAG: hypothetical protein LAQ30_21645 [Acidobacteriia bacterium]|nr:hypothetical protein [Terriglobia bacterium]